MITRTETMCECKRTFLFADSGTLLGVVAAVHMPHRSGKPRVVYAADVHDFDGEDEAGGEYDPISLGAYMDPDSPRTEIERRARDAHVI